MPRTEAATGTLNRLSSDTFEGTVFDSQSATTRNVLLTASTNFLVIEVLEIGASFNLEIPATSTVEVAGYATSTAGQTLTRKVIDTPTVRNWDGWEDANEVWTFNTATVINVPSGATTKYDVGDKIKLTQSGTVAYFYIVAVADNALTITGGSSYTFANSAVSANFYSKSQTPHSFPQWMSYTATETGFSSTTPTRVSRFCINGRQCHISTKRTDNQTSNATTYTFSAPVTSGTTGNGWRLACGSGTDNGAGFTTPVMCDLPTSSTTISLFKDPAAGAWTASGAKGADFEFIYEI